MFMQIVFWVFTVIFLILGSFGVISLIGALIDGNLFSKEIPKEKQSVGKYVIECSLYLCIVCVLFSLMYFSNVKAYSVAEENFNSKYSEAYNLDKATYSLQEVKTLAEDGYKNYKVVEVFSNKKHFFSKSKMYLVLKGEDNYLITEITSLKNLPEFDIDTSSKFKVDAKIAGKSVKISAVNKLYNYPSYDYKTELYSIMEEYTEKGSYKLANVTYKDLFEKIYGELPLDKQPVKVNQKYTEDVFYTYLEGKTPRTKEEIKCVNLLKKTIKDFYTTGELNIPEGKVYFTLNVD